MYPISVMRFRKDVRLSNFQQVKTSAAIVSFFTSTERQMGGFAEQDNAASGNHRKQRQYIFV